MLLWGTRSLGNRFTFWKGRCWFLNCLDILKILSRLDIVGTARGFGFDLVPLFYGGPEYTNDLFGSTLFKLSFFGAIIKTLESLGENSQSI